MCIFISTNFPCINVRKNPQYQLIDTLKFLLHYNEKNLFTFAKDTFFFYFTV